MKLTIVGCGRVGSGLAAQLDAAGHDVAVVDVDGAATTRLPRSFRGRSVIGSGLDRGVLIAAGVEQVDALAAVTGSDEINAVVARMAVDRFAVPRVVARMYDPRQADLYRRLGILTISPVAWGTSRLLELLTLRDVAGVVSLGGGQLDLTAVSVPAALDGRHCTELEVSGEIHVAALTRGARSFIPEGGTTLRSGDVAYVVVAAGAGQRLQELLGGEEVAW